MTGLQDKLYWRKAGGRYHCFKKVEGGGYTSLCGKQQRERSDGQGCDRPHPWLRCAVCDGKEADRRGWDESGPTSPSMEGGS